MTHPEHDLTLPRADESPALARAAVRAWLAADPRAAAAAGDVELVVSELVSHLVQQAAGGRLTRRLSLRDGGVHVEVCDTEPLLPRQGAPGRRGLVLVEAVSAEWGVEPAPTGSVHWADVPLVPRAI